MRELASQDVAVRRRASRRLGEVTHPDARVVAALIAALRDPDQHVRSGAARSLGRVGPVAAPAVDELFAVATGDASAFARNAALSALERLGADSCKIALSLEAAVDAGSVRVGSAVEALNRMGSCADEVVRRITSPRYLGALATRLRSESALDLIENLAAHGPVDCSDSVPFLVSALSVPQVELGFRECVAKTLGALGPVAVRALPALTAASRDGVRTAADAIDRVRMKEPESSTPPK